MDAIHYLLQGFAIAVLPMNLLYCFLGVLVGTLIGVLPGLGPAATLAMLLPLTFNVKPVSAMIMFCGIWYGAQYGGSTTSILINVPGESGSVVTCIDGYEMAKKGKAGAALGMAAFGSFIAGTFSVVILMFLAPPLANFALKFGPPEYFILMLFGLTTVTSLGGKPLKALIMATFGFALSMVGMDPMAGGERYTFGWLELADGIGFIPIAMGLFGVGEVLTSLEKWNEKYELINFKQKRLRDILPTTQDWIDCKWTLPRASLIGFFVGTLPGSGATVASFISYAVEKKFSKHPEKFGKGAIEGVAAPESANNSGVGGAMVPLLALGIPGSATTSLLFAAFLMFGLQPGPLLFQNNPEFVWGLLASMYIGNILLLALNLPLIGIWVRILEIPRSILFPMILVFIYVGAFSSKDNLFDLWVLLIFGFVGYFTRKYGYPAAPAILAYILGPIMEKNLRRSMALSHGSLAIFFDRWICVILIVLIILLLFLPSAINFWLEWRKKLSVNDSK